MILFNAISILLLSAKTKNKQMNTFEGVSKVHPIFFELATFIWTN
jgi:hypothetical protein